MINEPVRTINLLRPYRGWISGRELWQPGSYTLPQDAARHLVNGLYAEYMDDVELESVDMPDEPEMLPYVNPKLPRVELYQEMKDVGYKVTYRMKKSELLELLGVDP